MEPYILWLVVGIVLVIVELVTTTFYLLVLGAAAFAATLVAYFGLGAWPQAAIAAAVAVAGVAVVYRYRSKLSIKEGTNSLEYGQMVALDSWVNEPEGMARVKYRGAVWDAAVVGERIKDATTFYVCGTEGSTLKISSTKPS